MLETKSSAIFLRSAPPAAAARPRPSSPVAAAPSTPVATTAPLASPPAACPTLPSAPLAFSAGPDRSSLAANVSTAFLADSPSTDVKPPTLSLMGASFAPTASEMPENLDAILSLTPLNASAMSFLASRNP